MLTSGTFSGRGTLSPDGIPVEYELTRERVTKPMTSQHPVIVIWRIFVLHASNLFDDHAENVLRGPHQTS